MTDYPKVSVVTITYGHENYIMQTLDGVMMQDYPGKIEFIIANDNSPDQTDIVIKSYLSSAKIPENFEIKYTKHDANKGMMPNFIWALEHATGKYIALCEGDDYWTDPLKLQKQVDFLEANPDHILHGGKAQVLRDNILQEIIGHPRPKNGYRLEDFYTRNNLITCTVMFRNSFVITNSFSHLIFGDWKLYTIMLSQKPGSMAYVSDELYAVYRIHGGGIMQTVGSQIDSAAAHLMQIESINKDLKSKFTAADIYTINNYCLRIFQHHLSRANYKKSFSIIVRNTFLVGAEIPLRNYLGLIKNLLLKKSA